MRTTIGYYVKKKNLLEFRFLFRVHPSDDIYARLKQLEYRILRFITNSEY